MLLGAILIISIDASNLDASILDTPDKLYAKQELLKDEVDESFDVLYGCAANTRKKVEALQAHNELVELYIKGL